MTSTSDNSAETTEPPFRLEDYFAGRTLAWGLFQDRFGKVRRRFEVTIIGERRPNGITLTEDFVYDDGETERRVWQIERVNDVTYRGTADGVIGEAKGVRRGSALNWVYDFALKVGDGTWTVKFDDWLYLQSDGVVLNRAEVTKFGIRIGEATIVFVKPDGMSSVLMSAAE